LHLFATHGFAATTTRQIALAAGITEGLIFRYFPTKVSILQTIANERDALGAAFVNILASSHALPASLVVERIAEAWMTLTRREMDFMTMLISEGQIHPDVQPILHGAIQAAVTGLAQYLAGRVQAGEIRADVPLHTVAANFFGALLFFFLTHRSLDDAQWNEQAGAFISELRDTWLHGVQVPLHPNTTSAHEGGGHDIE
jgi:AcrR family transcriptional regulator